MTLSRALRTTALTIALSPLCGGAALAATVPPAAPASTAPAPVAALGPAQTVCPSAHGALTLGPDLSGWGTRSAGGSPVLLSPDRVAYLQTVRRPVPRVNALVAVTTAGLTLWQVPLGAAAAPSALATAGGSLDVALRVGENVRVEAFGPSTGDLQRMTTIETWPSDGPAPALVGDGEGGLLLTGPSTDLPDALSGLGAAPTPVADLGASLTVRWRVDGVGDVVAVAAGQAVAAVRTGAADDRVRLTDIDVADGRTLWSRTVALAGTPETASFAASRGVLVWSVTWVGGGLVGAIDLGDGQTLWQKASTLAGWIAVGPWAVGGPAVWQAPSALEAISLTSGTVAWRGPAATPVAALGGRVLAAAPSVGVAGDAWLWLTPPTADGPNGRALTSAAGPSAGAAPTPPVSLYCGVGALGAMLVAEERGGDLWSVAARATDKGA